jgi:hypothetical protein
VYTVFQRQGFYCQRAVVIDNLLLRSVHCYKLYLIVQVTTEEIYLPLEDVSQLCRGIHRQLGRTPQQSESAQHTDESKAVIAMKMGDEDGTDLREA